MSEEVIGEKKSWLQQRREDLVNWENKVGIINFSLEEEVKIYLSYTSSERKNLTPEECANISIALNNYAGYISKLSQDLDSEIYIIDEKIKQMILDRINQQNAFKFEEKMMFAIAENGEAKKLYIEKILLQAKKTRISYYSNKLDNISKSYQYLTMAKKKDRSYEN